MGEKLNMNKNKSNKIIKILDKQVKGWRKALGEAQAQMSQSKMRTRQLKEAVRLIEKKIENGEPWPGEEATQSPSQ
jgi:hypothetical protein